MGRQLGQILWNRMDLKSPRTAGIRTGQLPQRSGLDLTMSSFPSFASRQWPRTKRERGAWVFRRIAPSGSEAVRSQPLPLIFELLLSRNPEDPQGW
jgi:hypothetical protein